jgi:hypothetical protein
VHFFVINPVLETGGGRLPTGCGSARAAVLPRRRAADLLATSDTCLVDLRQELSGEEKSPGLCKSQQCWKSVRKAS